MYKNKKGCPLGATPYGSLSLTGEQRQTNDTNMGMRYAYPNGTFD